MAHSDAQRRVLEEWFQLPESRRRHATDAVAFAFRLMQDQPEIFSSLKDAVHQDTGHELIVDWLIPYLSDKKGLVTSDW